MSAPFSSLSRGEVYLAGFRRERDGIGKVRPALILQSDLINRVLHEARYKDVIVLPLTSLIRGTYFYFPLKKRDRLDCDSEVICSTVITLDYAQIDFDSGLITRLCEDELEGVEERVRTALGFLDREYL